MSFILVGNSVIQCEKISKVLWWSLRKVLQRTGMGLFERLYANVKFSVFSCFYQRLKLLLNKVKRYVLTSVVFLK